MTDKAFFSKNLLYWNRHNNTRTMPWKGEKDPYKIWISEIILQQTRVEQGLRYYNRFIGTFPTVKSIALANENQVFKLWEGLGYYTRCKNLIYSARYISKELDGNFPKSFPDLLLLKGVGQYTASAIASFAYNLPYAVTDGNVFRVLSRFFGIHTAVDTGTGKKLFSNLAFDLLDKKNPGIYNQAVMDFGAVVCKPGLPLCNLCPVSKRCVAFEQGLVQTLPVKLKNIIKRKRWIYYLVIEYKKKLYIKKRTGRDIWENLHEFVSIETSRRISIPLLLKSNAFKHVFVTSQFRVEEISKVYQQQLTHQTISGQFIRIQSQIPLDLDEYMLVSHKELGHLAFPKFITAYLKD
jgi:A/G-specific adenine glycosylase